jgi:hypothetical protein
MSFGKNNVHVSKPLTDFAVNYIQESKGFIANSIIPPMESNKEVDKYFQFTRGNWRQAQDLRAAGSQSNRFSMPSLTTATFSIEEHAGHDVVPFREIDEADSPLQPKQDSAEFIMEKLLINSEQDAASVMFTTTAAANNTSQTAATKWDVTTTATPIKDVETKINAIAKEIGRRANTGSMGADVFSGLKDSDDILDRIKYTQTGIITADLLAAAMDLDNILIGERVKMTTADGIASETTAYIWGNYFLTSYVNPRNNRKSITHARTFTKRNAQVLMQEFEDKKLGGIYVEGALFYDHKIVSTISASLITDPVA